MNEVLLRGCTIKNSGAVHGLVIYTGPESRIQMNAARPPKKTGEPLVTTFLGRRLRWTSAQRTKYMLENTLSKVY